MLKKRGFLKNKTKNHRFLACPKRHSLLNKKGEEILTPIIIFIVLNIAFFGILFGFVYKASTGALVYEQAYAKQIAMLIDAAEPSPSTVIRIDFREGVEIAKDSNLNRESLVRINNANKQVIVNLGRTKGGYATKFYSNYEVSAYPALKYAHSYNIVINKKGTKEKGEDATTE